MPLVKDTECYGLDRVHKTSLERGHLAGCVWTFVTVSPIVPTTMVVTVIFSHATFW